MKDRYASLKEGLVGAWIPSVSGSGFLLPDVSGRNNHGTLTNMASDDWVSSQYGRALDFDGTNDTVNIAFNRQPFQQATISLFAFTRNTSTTTLWFQNNFCGLFLSRFSAGKFLAFFDGTTLNNSAADESTTTILSNRWYHFAATNNGAVTRYYINGIAENSYSDTILQNASTLIWIGSNANTVQFVNGQMDDIRIYNRALSESEIRLLASRPGIGLTTQRRTAYYAPPSFNAGRLRRQQLIGSGVY